MLRLLVKKAAVPQVREFHVSAINQRVQSGRYKISVRRDKPLTYEMANAPHHIASRKSWNSWDTTTLHEGLRPAETALEDVFIRRFMTGTWHNLFTSEIIIKRQHNLIRVAGIVVQSMPPSKMYWLIGYTEELLSTWLQCPVKLELQTIEKRQQTVFKYI
uniref:EOG090X0I6M n=1 Tax=Evadne anonyx TaxID=141404 RepID=A0A9N6ZFB6_9CRUS|nr:EOG090X0I6M [Evadne anonyx]